MNQAAKDVDALDLANTRQHGHRRRRRGHRNIEVNAAVRPAGVVVLDIPGEDTLQVWPVPDQCPVQTLGADGAYPAFGVRVCLDARGGILMVSTPAAAKTASNATVNLASRSRIRKRNRSTWSSRSNSRLRAA
jgi:hypothetical protein